MQCAVSDSRWRHREGLRCCTPPVLSRSHWSKINNNFLLCIYNSFTFALMRLLQNINFTFLGFKTPIMTSLRGVFWLLGPRPYFQLQGCRSAVFYTLSSQQPLKHLISSSPHLRPVFCIWKQRLFLFISAETRHSRGATGVLSAQVIRHFFLNRFFFSSCFLITARDSAAALT